VPARDGELLVERVAAEADHLKTIVERVGDLVGVVRGGDEQHLREVVFDLQVVVAEGMVLLRVQHLHERRRGVATPIAAQLVELVQEEDGVVDAGLGESLDDASGHGADVGAAVAADLGLVAHATEGDACEGAAESLGHRPRHGTLARARRAGQAEDSARPVALEQAADGEVLEDAVLHVLQAIVRLVQMAGHGDHVDGGLGRASPRKVEDRVQQSADDRHLGAHGRRLPQLLDLARDDAGGRGGQTTPGEHARVPVRFIPSLSLDLVAQHLQLLLKKDLPLPCLDALLHLGGDLLFEAEHRVLLGEQFEKDGKALLGRLRLEQRLLLGRRDHEVGGDDVGDLLGVGRLGDHELDLVGNVGAHLRVVDELRRHPPGEGPAAGGVPVRGLDRRVAHDEVWRGRLEVLDTHALDALDDGLDAPVRQLEQLQHRGARAHGRDVVGVGVVFSRLPLGREDQRRLVAEGALDRADRLVAPHEEGRDHPREDDQFPRRQERERRRIGRCSATGSVRPIRRHAQASPSRLR